MCAAFAHNPCVGAYVGTTNNAPSGCSSRLWPIFFVGLEARADPRQRAPSAPGSLEPTIRAQLAPGERALCGLVVKA